MATKVLVDPTSHLEYAEILWQSPWFPEASYSSTSDLVGEHVRVKGGGTCTGEKSVS